MEKKDTHQLEYSIWSNKVSWCPICLKHFYNERNKMPTTKATKQHYHEVDNSEEYRVATFAGKTVQK